jgi:hypothetical protein
MPQFFTPGLLTQRMQQPNPGILNATPDTPPAIQPILSQQPIIRSGNKRDSVPIVQRANTTPDLTAHQYQARSPIDAFKTGNPDNALLMLGAGLLSGKSFSDGLGKGIAGYAQARQQDKADFQNDEQARISGLVNSAQLQQGQDRADFEKKQYEEGGELRKYQVEKAKQDIAAGKYQYHDGVITDVEKGTSVVDPAVIEAYRQQQAAKAPSWSPKGPLKGPNGEELGEGYSDGITPQLYVIGEDGKPHPAPPGSSEVGMGYGQGLSRHQLYQLQDTLVTEENAAKLLDDYSKKAGSLEGGIKGVADNWMVNVKSAMGQDLTQAELDRRIASGQLQGLVGLLRLDVLGPGVVTDQDALRFYQRLGGNLNTLTSNPQAVYALTQELLQQKMALYRQHVDQFNTEAGRYGMPSRQAITVGQQQQPTTPGTTPPPATAPISDADLLKHALTLPQ